MEPTIDELMRILEAQDFPKIKIHAGPEYAWKWSGAKHDDNIYDSEKEKFTIASESNIAGKNGFQGCKNQKECGFEGFYLCTYSREGLCDECEFKKFPQRYQGCMFCRRPQKMYSNVCSICKSGFEKWVSTYTNVENKQKFGYNRGYHELLHSLSHLKFEFIGNKTKGWGYTWPGFYCGNGRWFLPDEKMITTEEITRDNIGIVLQQLLEANGIFITKEIQMGM